MENATKALLIAGAILIVIILISFGLIVLNSTSDSAEGGLGTSEQIIKSTNSASDSAYSAMAGLNQWIK